METTVPLPHEAKREFEALLLRHRAQFYRVAYRMAGRPDEAEDLLQEALLEAYRAYGRFETGTRFDRWVYRIMTRTHIDRWRKSRRTATLSLETTGDGDYEMEADLEAPDPSPSPLDRALASETMERVQQALNALPDVIRVAIVLCDLEGFRYDEIAQIADVPVGTVRSRIHRGRSMLAERLKEYALEGG